MIFGGGEFLNVLSALVSLKIVLTKLSTFFGQYGDSKPQADNQTYISYIIWELYKENWSDIEFCQNGY